VISVVVIESHLIFMKQKSIFRSWISALFYSVLVMCSSPI
jgi:hypothetical protein